MTALLEQLHDALGDDLAAIERRFKPGVKVITCHFALLAKKGLVHHRPGIARGCRALPEVQP